MSILDRYDYRFPPSLIATAPASPRDSARLLVCRRKDGRTREARFADLPDLLPSGAVLVFNETKVVPARLILKKAATGGRVEALVVGRGVADITVMSDRRLDIGGRLLASRRCGFTVVGHDGKYWRLKPDLPMRRLDAVLDRYGRAPLPPYIKETPLSERQAREQYQTVFARTRGSVAAPTASLHFTRRLLAKLKRRGFGVEFITLHVGLGTFAPVTGEQLKQGRLHREAYRIAPAAARRLEAVRRAGRPVIAVGTTVMRALESAADARGRLRRLSGETDLFIREGYRFRFIDHLITNFHVPESSLLMLVSAFAGRRNIRRWYARAIRRRFRLFSFGDGMLIV